MQRNPYALSKMDMRQEKLETSMRKHNVIVKGLVEPQGGRENPREAVRGVIQELVVDPNTQYDQAYRIGQLRDDRIRPLFISFVRLEDREFLQGEQPSGSWRTTSTSGYQTTLRPQVEDYAA